MVSIMRVQVKTILIFILISATCVISNAQSEEPFNTDKFTHGLWHFNYSEPDCLWSMTFGGDRNDWSSKAILSRDGEYLVGGYSRSFGAGSSEFLLLKINTDGDISWSRTYGSPQRLICSDLVQLDNGNIALAGTLDLPAPRSDFLLMLISENGDSLWTRTYGDEGIRNCRALVLADGGGFLLGGTANDQRDDNDIWIVKTDNEGEIEWTRSFGTDGADLLLDIELIPGEGYLVAGAWYRDDLPISYIAKLDFDGEINWEIFDIGEGWGSICRSIIINEEGYIGTGNAGLSPWIVCLDHDGEMNWWFYHGVQGIWNQSIKTFDGGYVTAGTYFPPRRRHDIGLLKMTPNREGDWREYYGGEDWEYGYDVILNHDGSFTQFGSTTSFGAGDNDVWVVRTNPELSPITDLSGFFNTGEMVGEIGIEEGRWGNAMATAQNTGGYMVVQDDESLHPDSFTIEGFFHMNSEIDHTGAIVTKLIDDERFSYTLYASNLENEIGFILNSEDQTHRIFFETIPDNREWHYLVGSYDNTIMRLFYDGELVSESEIGEAVEYGDGPLIIGNAEENPRGESQFYGLIDEVRLSGFPVRSISPALRASTDTLNFELTDVDSSLTMMLEITNVGNLMAILEVEGPGEGGAFIWEDLDAYELSRGDTLEMSVTFLPNEEGEHHNWITLGYQEDEIEIFLIGSGFVNTVENEFLPLTTFDMLQASPNPFNSTVRFDYWISHKGGVRLIVYDLHGCEVALLLDQSLATGHNCMVWNASYLSNGVYFAQLSSSTGTITTKIMHVK